MPPEPRPVIQRIFARVAVEGECWIWQGTCTPGGYGNILGETPGSRVYVHRYVYQAFVGPILDGHEVDHLCQSTRCVRPSHLDAVTAAENRRRVMLRRTQCPYGHLFDEANTYWWRGHRYCRTCRHQRIRDARHERKFAA